MKTLRLKDLIVHEAQDFILINKPPFISTLEDRNDVVNISKLAKEYHENAQICHRLDKDTSGILAIARNPEAYRHLSMQFEDRKVKKTYHAVVDGVHDFTDILVDEPILKQNDGTVKISRQGKEAQTYFTTLNRFSRHTLVECRPITGRMHQIRIHLTRLNAPITGDETYGGKPFLLSSIKRGFKLEKETEEQPLIKRMALHAFALEFHDLENQAVRVEAPYPKDFQALLRQLARNLR